MYAIHCARRLGFSIRAVATLLPRENAVETDSYMYQSVGTTLGAAVAECLGVPHYSAHVKGQPINTETLQYTFDPNDEVNDLQLLLERVKVSVKFARCSAIFCRSICMCVSPYVFLPGSTAEPYTGVVVCAFCRICAGGSP